MTPETPKNKMFTKSHIKKSSNQKSSGNRSWLKLKNIMNDIFEKFPKLKNDPQKPQNTKLLKNSKSHITSNKKFRKQTIIKIEKY